MVVDFTIKPVGVSAPVPVGSAAPGAAKSAVQTQLPPDKTVTATDPSLPVQFNSQAEDERLSRQVLIDRAAAEVVYRVVDSRSGFVVRQFPDDTRLRARAYLRAQDMAKQDNTRKTTDLKV